MWGYPERFMPVPGSEYHPPARSRCTSDRARHKPAVATEGVS